MLSTVFVVCVIVIVFCVGMVVIVFPVMFDVIIVRWTLWGRLGMMAWGRRRVMD